MLLPDYTQIPYYAVVTLSLERGLWWQDVYPYRGAR
jgi:hypothetical protein